MRMIRDVRSVSSSVLLGLILSSVRSILVLRILPPAMLGAWKIAMLSDLVAEFGRLGVNRGVEVKIPVLGVKNDRAGAESVESTAAVFSVVLGLIYGILMFVIGCCFHTRELRLAFWAVAPLMAIAQPYFFLRDLTTARAEFRIRNRETVLRSAVDAVTAVAAAWLLQVVGLGLTAAVVITGTTLYLKRALGFRFRRHFEPARLRELVRIGFPYSLTEAAFEVVRRLDVVLMAILLGSTSVGYYGISLLVMDTCAVLARKGVSQVVSPHLMQEFGRTGSHNAVSHFYEAPARLFCYLLPPLLALGSFFIGAFVRAVMPRYTAGIPAAEVTMWAVFFVALHASFSSFFVAADRVRVVLRIYAVLIPLAAAAQWAVQHAGLGLVGAAWTTVATLAVLSSSELVLARSSCGASRREIALHLGSLYLPLGATMALKAGIDALLPGLDVHTVLRALAGATVLLALYAPILWIYETRFSMLRTVRHAT